MKECCKRIHMVRFRIDAARDGIELLPMGE